MPDSHPGFDSDGSAASPSRGVDSPAVPSGGTPRDAAESRPATPHAPDPSVPPAAARAVVPAWLKITAATVATALVSAFAAALISPERVGSWFGQDSSSDSEARDATGGPSAAPVEFKRVASSDGAITYEAPEGWAARASGFSGVADLPEDAGEALRASLSATQTDVASNETVWIGASQEGGRFLGTTDMSDDAVHKLMQQRLDVRDDFLQAGCVPSAGHRLQPGGDWISGQTVWEDCSSLTGWRVWELEMTSADRLSYVVIQMGLGPDMSDDVAQKILGSIAVLPDRLPRSTSCPTGNSCDQPSG